MNLTIPLVPVAFILQLGKEFPLEVKAGEVGKYSVQVVYIQ